MLSSAELRIPDIINSHEGPVSLSQIAAAAIPDTSSSPDISCLAGIMSLLVRRNIFTAQPSSDGSGDTSSTSLYGLTHSSRWLLSEDQLTVAPLLLMDTSAASKEGGIAFEKANGREIWDFASQNQEFNKLLNGGMACTVKIVMNAILSAGTDFGDGFGCLGSLVGGGTGAVLSEIVKSHPHIKGINFDLPHVVATVPAYPGVSHVGGGKERTETEWKKILKEGGFPRHKIIKIPALPSIIEVYPE
ncbi:hypothetical protein TIFTF001_042057 [Ficus carica]|uniref:O-methyltransferase domain-containing protein n=1 Tax=Ficus carica TaxID=3494 RepID=A0AA88CTL2_FICCA|nr:hypothetical protein TIFTF001_042040 [Ficus carica]GMN34448.1 hypothetical protein TIFTF001_042057 [Ficus carica]